MKNDYADRIIEVVWNSLRKNRSYNLPVDHFLNSCLYILYGYHKGYDADLKNAYFFNTTDDDLLNELKRHAMSLTIQKEHFVSLYLSLKELKYTVEEYASGYRIALRVILDRYSTSFGRKTGEGYLPTELSYLVAILLKQVGCSSVYNPFCGIGSIANSISQIKTEQGREVQYVGQGLYGQVGLLARLVCESIYEEDGHILSGDCIGNWSDKSYDAVVCNPPYGLRIGTENLGLFNGFGPAKNLEELIVMRSLIVNQAKTLILFQPQSFCYSQRYEQLRKFLVENNYISTIFSLPSNLLANTSLPIVMLVIRNISSVDDSIHFYYAENYVKGERRKERRFDLDAFMEQLNEEKEGICSTIHSDLIKANGYNLNPCLYEQTSFHVQEGQTLLRLADLITIRDKKRPSSEVSLPSIEVFKKNLIDILLNKNSTESILGIEFDDAILVEGTNNIIECPFSGYFLHTDGRLCLCENDCNIFEINDYWVHPEYLVYLLTQNKAINEGRMSLKHFLGLHLVIDSKEKQSEIISKLIQDYNNKKRLEQEADARRLGIKQNISDLEHLLGANLGRIRNIIDRLERITPESPRYLRSVKDLKDNFEYVNRAISYSNSILDTANFKIEKGNLTEFIDTYCESWKNYGGTYFDIQIQNNLKDSSSVFFDRTMFTLMLDSILKNAARHSFKKQDKYTEHNVVQISLSEVEYQNQAFVLISVSNNGDPIREDFTINDYISRGRYSADSGHSGLGGYHVYQVVKGHNGYLNLDSTKVWNVIVNVLIPLRNENVELLTSFENECI